MARGKFKVDLEAIVAFLEEEAHMFKSTEPRLIVAGCDPSTSRVIGLELEHVARKLRRDFAPVLGKRRSGKR